MKIALIGYGKMGQTIEKIAKERGHFIVLTIDHNNPQDLTIENLQKADVAIEFTRPEAAVDNIKTCIQAGTPVVSGTTGWLKHFEEVKSLCNASNGTFMYSSNYSLGVNIFFRLNQYLAEIMQKFPEYNTSIEEIHHTQKLDAPSGTAITLAEGILTNSTHLTAWSKGHTNQPGQIPIYSLREDTVPGTHTVKYDNDIDKIEIKHTAHNREGFARGAVLAAEWLVGRKGVFGIKDMLSL